MNPPSTAEAQMFDKLRQDVRFASRSLRRSPVFTVVAILSIGIGVGATTAIVTLANTMLLKAAPGIGDPDRVVLVGSTRNGRGFDNFSYPNFVDYRDGARTLSGLAAIRIEPQSLSLAGPSGGEPIQGGLVSGSFFSVLQAIPSHGRFFTADEDQLGGANTVVVLSHAFWSKRFASDPSIVGRDIVLNGKPFSVVGVASPGFNGPFVLAPDLWVPVTTSTLLNRTEDLFANRGAVWIMAVGRLAQNVSLSAAQAELSAIAARQEQEYKQSNEGKGVRVAPTSLFPGDMRKIVGVFMAVLFTIAGLVLVIASTNVAGMMLARAAARQREIAVRLALGASRSQLVRQLVTESLMLFVLAGVVGVFLAHWLVVGLMALIPRLPVQLKFDPQMDWRVLLFALGASLLTGMAAGLVPAFQSTNPALVPALKLDAGTSGRRHRLRSGLLVSQIAFSMLLLIVAGLFARTLVHARNIDPGFDPRGVHIASLDFSLANYDETRGLQFASTLLEQTRQLPAVRSAAFSVMLPLDGGGMGLGGIVVEGRPASPERRSWGPDWNVVTPGYFTTIGIAIVKGRDFTDADRAGTPHVAILNETFAENLYPGVDPIGRTFQNGDLTVTVVGVARNGKYRTLGESPRNFVYVAMAQRYIPRTMLLVKTEGGAQVATPLRQLVARLDRSLPILYQRSLVEHAATSLFPQRIALLVAGSLGGVALLLALLGIYGVTAFSVTQRTREIGVRMALGSQRGQVLALILRQGVRLAIIGVAIGAMVGFAVTRLLGALLYGVPATDAAAFVGAAVLLSSAAVIASWLPARRAAGIDPVIALRAE